MKTLLASTTVLFTIMTAVAFGIAFGYALIIAILRACGHKSLQPEKVSAVTVPVSTTAQ